MSQFIGKLFCVHFWKHGGFFDISATIPCLRIDQVERLRVLLDHEYRPVGLMFLHHVTLAMLSSATLNSDVCYISFCHKSLFIITVLCPTS